MMKSTRARAHRLAILLSVCMVAALLGPAGRALPVRGQEGVQLPPGFALERVAEKLDGPTSFAFAPDGRIFVTQKAGVVKVIHDGQLQPENVIDLSPQVNQAFDRGLMSVAVHPRWPAAPYLYLAYTFEPPEVAGHARDGARVARVVRVQADPGNLNRALPQSETVILGKNSTFAAIGNPDKADAPPYSCRNESGVIPDCIAVEGTAHGANMVRFGPDGALYVAVGDGVSYGEESTRAQDPDSLGGKILRIDPVSGGGYGGNPLANGNPAANRSRVYMLGMRNPFRFAFHPTTGEIWLGDVGQGAWEEINRGRAGANFGWPCFEGPDQGAAFPICAPLQDGTRPPTPPVHSYPHAGRQSAAIGGDFYTGRNFPAQYYLAYFFADFNGGRLNMILPDGSVQEFGRNLPGPVQITMGPDGALYLLHIMSGTLDRIVYTDGPQSSNRPPVATFEADLAAGTAGSFAFTSGGSFDPEGGPLRYSWDFGDGTRSEEPNPTHGFDAPGDYRVTLTLADAQGATAQATRTVTVAAGQTAPEIAIQAPAAGAQVPVGSRVEFRAAATDAEDGALTGDVIRWTARLHHNEHVHDDFLDESGTSGSFIFADHGDNTWLELCATATDSTGATSTACTDVRGMEVIYTFDSVPRGAALLYEGMRQTTPFTVSTYVGATRLIEAPTTADGRRFVTWSDGGQARHELTIGPRDRSFFAVYAPASPTTASD